MQPKHFNLLAIAAVISLIAAGVVHSSYNRFDDGVVTGQRLLPALEGRGDAIGKVVIQRGEKTITLNKAKDGKGWSLVERANYPVDAKKIRKLVISLAQAELIEKKTRNKELHGALDLGDPTEKDANAKLVRLADGADQTIAEVVIGKERRGAFGTGQAGTYVRVPGDPQTWLAKMEVNASTDVVDWVEPAFFKIDREAIAAITVKKGAATVYKLARASGAKKEDEAGAAAGQAAAKADKKAAAEKPTLKPLEFVEVPAGRKVKESVRIDDLVNGIRTLELKDVRKAEADDGKPDMTAEIVMRDGATYQIGMRKRDDKPWLTVSVAAAGKGDTASAAKAIAETTKGWAYEIPQWRADQTFKSAADLFEKVAQDKAEDAAGEGAENGAPKMSIAPQRSEPTAAPK